MDLPGVVIGKLCGVALNANAALLADGVNGADLYQRFAASAKQDAEILAVSGLPKIGALADTRFDQLVNTTPQILEQSILIKAINIPGQDKCQTVYEGRLGSRLQNNGTDFHITAFKT
jgi:hypothetical protein